MSASGRISDSGHSDGTGVSQTSWRELVNEIAELEELLTDLHQQCDSLSLMNQHRLRQALQAKRRMLRMNDVHGVLV